MKEPFDELVGKVVARIYLDKREDPEQIVFDCGDGGLFGYVCYGDCCSSTWIEHLQGLDQLLAARISKVEEPEMPDIPREQHREEDQAYGLKITTEKGYCLIEYRNSSNGYYGGSLDPASKPAIDGMIPVTEDF